MDQYREGTVRNFNTLTGEKTCRKSIGCKKIFVILFHQTRNRNKVEYQNYRRMPQALKKYFSKIYTKQEKLFSVPVQNHDGSIAKCLKKYNRKLLPSFWEKLDESVELMIEHNYYVFDIGLENIVVHVSADGETSPVLIDCKRIGIIHHPVQLNLLFKGEKEKKLRRKYERLKEEYYNKTRGKKLPGK